MRRNVFAAAFVGVGDAVSARPIRETVLAAPFISRGELRAFLSQVPSASRSLRYFARMVSAAFTMI